MGEAVDVILRGVELECCKKLAEYFERGEIQWRSSNDWHLIGLTDENYVPVLSTLAQYSLIGDVQGTNACRFSFFKIRPGVVQVVRHLERQEAEEKKGKDVVAQTTESLRRHPIMGYVILSAIALATLLVIIANALTIMEKLGWINFAKGN